jgi:hypothetical protein
MFLKQPKASTDQRVRSLLQKAARRGFTEIVDHALDRLETNGEKAWLKSRTIVITFEESWPLASSLKIDNEPASKRRALLNVTRATKQKDAAGLGALAYAYGEGDNSMLDLIPDHNMLRKVSDALKEPSSFFEWINEQPSLERSKEIIRVARQYLSVATWPWDKATILAGALLSTINVPPIEILPRPSEEFPYFVALDKHTPQGKVALHEIAKNEKVSYRQLIWASFYFESARVNMLLPSPWWEAEKKWRLRRTGLSLTLAENLWARVRPLVSQHLETEAVSLKKLVEPAPHSIGNQDKLF